MIPPPVYSQITVRVENNIFFPCTELHNSGVNIYHTAENREMMITI